MKRKVFAGLLAAALALSGCAGTAGGAEDSGTDSFAETVPVTEDTIESAGIDTFISLPEYRGIELTRPEVTVTDEEVSELVRQDLRTYRIEVPDQAIQNLFWVEMSYAGTIDGQPFSGSSADSYALQVGTGMFPSEFESQLLGHKQGERVSISVTFPGDYTNPEIAGKTAVYDVNIRKVSVEPAEPTEEWLDRFFEGISAEEYKARKREEIAASRSAESDSELLTEAWHRVYDAAEILRYPKDLIDTWVRYSEDMYARYAKSYNMSYEDFCSEYGITATGIERDAREYAGTWMTATAILVKEGIEPGGELYREKRSELLKKSGYPSEEAAAAAGITEENIDMTTRYDLASRIIFDNAVITDTNDR